MDIALKKKNVYNPVEVMNMSKEVKTNAMRMLDKHHIRYDMIQYECDEFIDGLPTFIHNSAENFDKIYVSGGRIGTTICLDPKELAEVTRAQFADIIVHEA